MTKLAKRYRMFRLRECSIPICTGFQWAFLGVSLGVYCGNILIVDPSNSNPSFGIILFQEGLGQDQGRYSCYTLSHSR